MLAAFFANYARFMHAIYPLCEHKKIILKLIQIYNSAQSAEEIIMKTGI